jgi:hypothetical protein
LRVVVVVVRLGREVDDWVVFDIKSSGWERHRLGLITLKQAPHHQQWVS